MKLINLYSARHRLFALPFIFFLLLITSSGYLNSGQTTSRSDYKLSGKVKSTEGSSFRDMEVLLYRGIEDYPENPEAIAKTRANGKFKFKAEKNKSYVVEFRGELGAGRVFIPAENPSTRLKIVYPVTEKLVILHTNDLHFDINLHQEMTERISEIRANCSEVFLMDAGDVFVRHSARWNVNGKLMEDSAWYGKRTIEMINSMNELGYDVMTLGNHELAFIEPYTRLALESARFPLLAANIGDTPTGLPPLEHYVIFNTNTCRRLSVLGLTGGQNIPETVSKFSSLRDLSDVYIALTHIGFRNDTVLANRFPEFDVIVGGHSHHLLEEAILFNNVLVAQAGGCPHFVSDDHPVYLGIIELSLENGILKEKKGRVERITQKKK